MTFWFKNRKVSLKRFEIPNLLPLLSLKYGIKNPNVRDYIKNEMDHHNASLMFQVLIPAVFLHLGLNFFLNQMFLPPSICDFMSVFHLGTIALIASYVFLQYFVSMEFLVLVFQKVLFVTFVIVAHYGAPLTTEQGATYISLALLSFSVFFVLMNPYYNLVPVFSLVFYLCASYFALKSSPDMYLFFIPTVLLTTFVFGTSNLGHINTIRRLEEEIKMRFQIAPVQLVKKSIEAHTSIDELFKPQVRPCVCLSSDWRNYQRLTSRLEDKEVEEILTNYYQEVEILLAKAIPEGNYFTDWIADELFVVCYVEAEDETEIDGCLAQLLNFSNEILHKKEEIFSFMPACPGVDVGIAAGAAYVGMMGPPGNKKATSLGELPGKSRRLQTVGKLLRKSFGDEDRIIIDSQTLMKLKTGFDFTQVNLADGVELRDIPDRQIFFTTSDSNRDSNSGEFSLDSDVVELTADQFKTSA